MLPFLLLAALAATSLALAVWQLVVARRFPLHRRAARADGYVPTLSILKPLKGCDQETARCLRSWLEQEYPGPTQFLFGVASADDPVCGLLRDVMAEFPKCDGQLVIHSDHTAANAKVATLLALEARATGEVLVISDSDVVASPGLLPEVVAPLGRAPTGLVCCFYQLTHRATWPMRLEALAVNSDFWSQVLQARSLHPLDFALGAVMAVRRDALGQSGGLAAVADYLADDYQLGRQVAQAGWRIELSTRVVECREAAKSARQVWRHQVRWARTIRVCQPGPYFFSILSNATLWPMLAAAAWPQVEVWAAALAALFFRTASALAMQARLTREPWRFADAWLVPVRDLLGAAVWALAFLGHEVHWRGLHYRVLPGGKMVRVEGPP